MFFMTLTPPAFAKLDGAGLDSHALDARSYKWFIFRFAQRRAGVGRHRTY